jgi:hypothetical protein
MPDYFATFTIHLNADITARDEDSATKKAERLFGPIIKKIEAELPIGIELEVSDFNPEVNEA